jgi:SAM-dependent methyltransferase
MRSTGSTFHLQYAAADCEHLELENGRYDAAFFSHSLHHIDDVARMLGMLKRNLAASNLIYIDDYVGPSRDGWQNPAVADRELQPAREVWATLPDELKIMEVNPPLDLSDPSEMIRSDAIMPAIESTFEVIHRAPYWGNLLFPLLTALDGELLSQPQYQPLLRELIDKERELVVSGAFDQPLFAFFLART